MSALIRNRLPEKIPLLLVLVTSFVTLNVLAVSLVGYLSFRNGQQAVNDVASQLRSEITTRIEDHLHTFLNTPRQINQTNANLLQQELLTADDASTWERHFWQQIQIFDSVSSIYLGNTEGGLIDAGREGAGGFLYVIATDGFVSGPFKKYATDSRGQRTDLLVTVPDFDARTRPWYTGAVDRGDIAWSEPYILFTGQDMAIAASQPVHDQAGQLLGVVSVDLFLSHLNNFLQNLEIGETGHGFIMDRSGLLVASSAPEMPFTPPDENDTQRRLHANEIDTPLIRRAAEALAQEFGDYNRIVEVQQLEFELDGSRQFLQVSPIQLEDGLDWLVVVVVPEADFMAQINSNNRFTALLVVFTLVVTIILAAFVTRKIIGPIFQLNRFAYALSNGEWKEPISHDSRIREISLLTRSLNHMAGQLQKMVETLTAEVAERKQTEEALQQSNRRLAEALTELKQTQEKMVQHERLAAVGQLTSGIAHDFNNILSSILGFTELMQLSPDMPAAMLPDLEKINASGQRAAYLVRQLLDFSRKTIRQPKQFDLADFIRNSIKFFERAIPENIRILLDVAPGDYLIEADPTQLQQVITNLALNARDAMPAGGQLDISLYQGEIADKKKCVVCDQVIEGKWVTFAVADSGQGIDPETLTRIFEPFFTTKEIGQGTGLGLSQVYGIIEQHDGHITVDSRLNQGTKFTIHLPPASESSNKVEEESIPAILVGNGETILLVEDDSAVMDVGQALLKQLNYQVLAASNGREALTVYRNHQSDIALVLSDMIMPDMAGDALFLAIKTVNPDVKMILMSGYPLDKKGSDLLEQGVIAWLKKPISYGELSQALGQALAKRKGRWD